MKINIKDIPAEGLSLNFQLDPRALNKRVNAVSDAAESGQLQPPEYCFEVSPSVEVKVTSRGSMVMLKGKTYGATRSVCARCAEDIEVQLEAKIDYVIKPRPNGASVDEDLHYSYYDGEEVDCAVLAEESLVLSLPYSAFCTGEAAPRCSGTLALHQPLDEEEQDSGDERLAIFRTLKVTDMQ